MKRWSLFSLFFFSSSIVWPYGQEHTVNNLSLPSLSYNFLPDPSQSRASRYQLTENLGTFTLYSIQNCQNGRASSSSCSDLQDAFETGVRYSKFYSDGRIETYVGASMGGFNHANELRRRYSGKLSAGIAYHATKNLSFFLELNASPSLSRPSEVEGPVPKPNSAEVEIGTKFEF